MRNWNTVDTSLGSNPKFSCEPTYEELKQYQTIQKTLDRLQVASLPMRNWNFGESSSFGEKCLVASLPMRNWNFHPPWKPQKAILVASLPMRNWNNHYIRTKSTHLTRCEPTYEELKHVKFIKDGRIYLGCEPTYEELKLVERPPTADRRPPLRAYLWGIETRGKKCLNFPEL